VRQAFAGRVLVRFELMALATTLAVLSVGVPARSATVTQMLRAELQVQRGTLRGLVQELQQSQSLLEDSWERVDRSAQDLVRAQQEGEDAESLASRDADLRDAEGELMMRLFACQRVRSKLAMARERISGLVEELKNLEARGGEHEDPISGRWKVIVDPGGLKGELELHLNGTLVDGIYHLEGGWFGSLRGTLVAGRVRLERVDSKLGLAAVYYGKLTNDDPPRLQGTWDGTHLTSGQPSAGTWVAEKIKEAEDTGSESGYPEP